MTVSEQMVSGGGQGVPDAGHPAAPGRRPVLRWRVLLSATGLVVGLAVAGALVGAGHLWAGPRDGAEVMEANLLARVARVEARLDEMAAVTDRPDAGMPGAERALAVRVPENNRFIAAALLLQAAVVTPRPWMREYQAMIALAPPGALPQPLAEVLLSHAARGLPTEAELRERYAMLMPQLAARAPHDGSLIARGFTAMRSAFANIGLAAPPAATDQEQAIAGVAQQLRRGNLAAAVADAGALDPTLGPLLAGWLAQAGARLAVEQAVQETLLRALTTHPRPI